MELLNISGTLSGGPEQNATTTATTVCQSWALEYDVPGTQNLRAGAEHDYGYAVGIVTALLT